MTEPATYMLSDFVGNDFTSLELPKNPNNPRGLYFKEQLHPRVKMTQKQYKEWQSVIGSIYPVDLYELFHLIFNAAEHQGEYAGMRDIFSFDKGQKKLAQLWSDFDPDNPEEMIEILPTMKWFVQMKNENEKTRFLHKNLFDRNHVLNYGSLKYYAKHFDTKEEAELWTTPDTEAVHLPVEEQL